jgi:hypothetical protein
MQEHIVAFAIAVFAILWIGWVFMYRDQLFADITGANNSIKNTVYASPLVYSIQNGELTIAATKEFTDAKSVSLFLVFDPKKVLFWLEKATSPYTYTYAPWLDTMVQVTIFVPWNIAENTVLYTVPLNGSEEDVTITNASILWNNNVFETLAIQKK